MLVTRTPGKPSKCAAAGYEEYPSNPRGEWCHHKQGRALLRGQGRAGCGAGHRASEFCGWGGGQRVGEPTPKESRGYRWMDEWIEGYRNRGMKKERWREQWHLDSIFLALNPVMPKASPLEVSCYESQSIPLFLKANLSQPQATCHSRGLEGSRTQWKYPESTWEVDPGVNGVWEAGLRAWGGGWVQTHELLAPEPTYGTIWRSTGS